MNKVHIQHGDVISSSVTDINQYYGTLNPNAMALSKMFAKLQIIKYHISTKFNRICIDMRSLGSHRKKSYCATFAVKHRTITQTHVEWTKQIATYPWNEDGEHLYVSFECDNNSLVVSVWFCHVCPDSLDKNDWCHINSIMQE